MASDCHNASPLVQYLSDLIDYFHVGLLADSENGARRLLVLGAPDGERSARSGEAIYLLPGDGAVSSYSHLPCPGGRVFLNCSSGGKDHPLRSFGLACPKALVGLVQYAYGSSYGKPASRSVVKIEPLHQAPVQAQ